MNRSTDRILTTHVGSLPRPEELIDVMVAEDKGVPVGQQEYDVRSGHGRSLESRGKSVERGECRVSREERGERDRGESVECQGTDVDHGR